MVFAIAVLVLSLNGAYATKTLNLEEQLKSIEKLSELSALAKSTRSNSEAEQNINNFVNEVAEVSVSAQKSSLRGRDLATAEGTGQAADPLKCMDKSTVAPNGESEWQLYDQPWGWGHWADIVCTFYDEGAYSIDDGCNSQSLTCICICERNPTFAVQVGGLSQCAVNCGLGARLTACAVRKTNWAGC